MTPRRLFPLFVLLAFLGVVGLLRTTRGAERTTPRAPVTVPAPELSHSGAPLLPPAHPGAAARTVVVDGRVVAYPLGGEVREHDGAPLAGARVEVLLCGFGPPQVLGVTTTDEAGHYEVDGRRVREEVARFAEAEEDALRDLVDEQHLPDAPGLLVHVEAAGYLPGRTEHDVPLVLSKLDPPPRLDVELAPGFAWTGRIVDSEGKPQPAAPVTLQRRLPPRSDERAPTVVSRHVDTGRDGRFGFENPEGTFVALSASSAGVGRGECEGLGPHAGQPHDFGDLVLERIPDIAGRVVAEDGTPLPGQCVRAIPVSDEHGGRALEDSTDARGAFRLEGLSALEYDVFTYDEGSRWLLPGPGTGSLNVAGGSMSVGGETLTVFPDGSIGWPEQAQPAVRARAGDEGVLLVAPGVWAVLDAEGPPGHSLGMVDVQCFRLADESAAPVSAESLGTVRLGRSSGDEGAAAADARRLAVAGPATLLLRATVAGLPAVEDEVQLAADQCVLRHTIHFPSEDGFGSLHVDVHAEDRRSLPLSRITLVPARAGEAAIEVRDAVVDEATGLARITPGAYFLDVTPIGAPGELDFHLPFRAAEPVVVRAGEEVRVDVTAEARGGRVEVTVHAPGGRASDAASVGKWRTAKVQLQRDASIPSAAAPDPWRAPEGRSPRQYSYAPGIPLSLPDVLRPGTYELRAELANCEPLVVPVDVEPGLVTSVSVTLTRKP